MLYSAGRCENIMQFLTAAMTKIVLKSHRPYEENRSLKHHVKEVSRRSVSLRLLLCMLCRKRFWALFIYATLQGQQQQ